MSSGNSRGDGDSMRIDVCFGSDRGSTRWKLAVIFPGLAAVHLFLRRRNFLSAARVVCVEQISAQAVVDFLQVDVQICDLASGARLFRILLLNVRAADLELDDLCLQLARRELLLVQRGGHLAQLLCRLVALRAGVAHLRIAARLLVAPVSLPEVQAGPQHRAQVRRAEAEACRADVAQRGRVRAHVELDDAVFRQHRVAERAGKLAGEGRVTARDACVEGGGVRRVREQDVAKSVPLVFRRFGTPAARGARWR